MTPTRLPRILTSRFGIIVAVTIGFGVGAAGFAAAQHDDPSPATAPTTSVSSVPSTSIDDDPSTAAAGIPSTSVDDGPSTTAQTVPSTSVDGGPSTSAQTVPSTSVDDGVDDGPSTSIGGVPSTSVDDAPSSTAASVPSTSIDEGPSTTIGGGPSTTVAVPALPEPFTTTYSSSGGSINITWSGTAFRLNSVSPAPGFRAEIEDQAWDRVRVDFESEGVDARIEVRINDGSLRVRVD